MTYQSLLDILLQLEEDQSFYEAALGHELRGFPHLELVIMGGKMCKKVRLFADCGRSADLQNAFVSKVIDCIKEYMNLMMPPKICGGFCPCLRPARQGPEYEKKFIITLAKVVSTLFECEAVVIEFCAERLNLGSMHFVDYISRMDIIYATLANICGKITDEGREACRIELLATAESVRRFLNLFGTDTIELISYSEVQLSATSEILVAPAVDWNIAKMVLVKAVSNLQKIMNAAAALCIGKAVEGIRTLNSLSFQLKVAYDCNVAAFYAIEGRISERSLKDVLHTLVRESEDIHFNSTCKINEAASRWTAIKCQSNARPVIQYVQDEDFDD